MKTDLLTMGGGLFSLRTKWKNHSHDSVKYTVLQGEKQYIFVKS